MTMILEIAQPLGDDLIDGSFLLCFYFPVACFATAYFSATCFAVCIPAVSFIAASVFPVVLQTSHAFAFKHGLCKVNCA